MNDSLRSNSTNDSVDSQQPKKKKKPSRKTNSQQISYNELLTMLNPVNLFVKQNLGDKFEAIQIPDEKLYSAEFQFAIDQDLNFTEVKWRRLPIFLKIAA